MWSLIKSCAVQRPLTRLAWSQESHEVLCLLLCFCNVSLLFLFIPKLGWLKQAGVRRVPSPGDSNEKPGWVLAKFFYSFVYRLNTLTITQPSRPAAGIKIDHELGKLNSSCSAFYQITSLCSQFSHGQDLLMYANCRCCAQSRRTSEKQGAK